MPKLNDAPIQTVSTGKHIPHLRDSERYPLRDTWVARKGKCSQDTDSNCDE